MNEPWLVFLHGINDGGEHERWLDPLDTEMSLVGSTPFLRDRIVLPDYRAQLRGGVCR